MGGTTDNIQTNNTQIINNNVEIKNLSEEIAKETTEIKDLETRSTSETNQDVKHCIDKVVNEKKNSTNTKIDRHNKLITSNIALKTKNTELFEHGLTIDLETYKKNYAEWKPKHEEYVALIAKENDEAKAIPFDFSHAIQKAQANAKLVKDQGAELAWDNLHPHIYTNGNYTLNGEGETATVTIKEGHTPIAEVTVEPEISKL
jgi:uncharacterized protein YukE